MKTGSVIFRLVQEPGLLAKLLGVESRQPFLGRGRVLPCQVVGHAPPMTLQQINAISPGIRGLVTGVGLAGTDSGLFDQILQRVRGDQQVMR